MPAGPENGKVIAGLGGFLGLATGVDSLVVVLFAFFAHEWIAAELCLIAAALASGLIANTAPSKLTP